MNISNIFELYQGLKPIRRVYLDGTMVWAEPYFLPSYLVHLNHYLDGDQYLTRSRLGSGYMNVTDAADFVEIDNNLTAASIALLNGDLDEKQIVSVHRSVLNDLAVKLVNDVFSEHFLVYSDEYLTTIATELIAHSKSELARTLREAHGFVAASRIGNHSADYDVLDEYYHQSAVMHSSPGSYEADNLVTIEHVDRAASVNGETSGHESDYLIDVGYSHDALSAGSEDSGHESDYLIDVDHVDRAVSAESETSTHNADFMLDIDDHGGLLDAPAKHGVLDDDACVEFDQADHYAIDLTAACIVDEHEQSVEYDASANAAKGDAESVSANKSAIVEFGSDSVLNTLFWLLPVQTDTDLYVPMIYDDGVVVGAIQNGVNLDMRTQTT